MSDPVTNPTSDGATSPYAPPPADAAPTDAVGVPTFDALDPAGGAASASQVPAPAPADVPDAGDRGPGAENGGPSATDRAKDLAERLRPLAVAAEEVAATAVHLGAQGLERLGRLLDVRKEARRSGDGTPADPTETPRP